MSGTRTWMTFFPSPTASDSMSDDFSSMRDASIGMRSSLLASPGSLQDASLQLRERTTPAAASMVTSYVGASLDGLLATLRGPARAVAGRRTTAAIEPRKGPEVCMPQDLD